MSISFQFRRDTAGNWTRVNPVLLEGEIGIETDMQQVKLGNGATAWNSLSYWNINTENIDGGYSGSIFTLGQIVDGGNA
jgi:hypothetical protein